jgi:hypothetical protein
MPVKWVLFLLAVVAVGAGVRELWVAAGQAQPLPMTCRDYLAQRPSATWLALTDCHVDYGQGIRVAKPPKKRAAKAAADTFYAPVRASSDDTGPVLLWVKASGGVAAQIEEAVAAGVRPPVDGKAQLTGMLRTDDELAERLAAAPAGPTQAASGWRLLEVGKKPSARAGGTMLALGLLVLAAFGFDLRREARAKAAHDAATATRKVVQQGSPPAARMEVERLEVRDVSDRVRALRRALWIAAGVLGLVAAWGGSLIAAPNADDRVAGLTLLAAAVLLIRLLLQLGSGRTPAWLDRAAWPPIAAAALALLAAAHAAWLIVGMGARAAQALGVALAYLGPALALLLLGYLARTSRELNRIEGIGSRAVSLLNPGVPDPRPWQRRMHVPKGRRLPGFLAYAAVGATATMLASSIVALLVILARLLRLTQVRANLPAVLGPFLSAPLYRLGARALHEARRHGSIDARSLLASDPRRPILLLRSFADDNRAFKDAETAGWLGSTGYTFEEVLTRRLTRYGPVVAIGRPGEPLPSAGAAREYLTDDTWRARVEELVHGAAAVVVLAGPTMNLAWELARIQSLAALAKLLLIVPADHREEAAQRLRAVAGNLKSGPLASGIAHLHDDALAVRIVDGRIVELASPRRLPRDYEVALDLGMSSIVGGGAGGPGPVPTM